MSADAVTRLEAISQAQDLGAGFNLASHDLEIRGAGELLGDEQSGQIQSVGFSLNREVLDRPVHPLRNAKDRAPAQALAHGQPTKLNLPLPSPIPGAYLPTFTPRLPLS